VLYSIMMNVFKKEASLYESLPGRRVRCTVCAHRCEIDEGNYGFCRTRKNEQGTLYTLGYGKVFSISNNPIEMKPLYHFFPGTHCLSLGTAGCTFRCPGCQNWELSRASIETNPSGVLKLTPGESVELAQAFGCEGISWTFNEPTVWFEYTLESAKHAKSKGLYTVYVTNGFLSPAALDALHPYLDAFRVDIKGFSSRTYMRIAGVDALSAVLECTRRAKSLYGMHVECVTNLTPEINDDEHEIRDLAGWIVSELGPDIPWHVTRFYPYLHLNSVPMTPIEKLESVREIGIEAGLEFVYIGNVSRHPAAHTFCPTCSSLLIERHGYEVSKVRVSDGKCPVCGKKIYGVFQS
jgi:pyruvate formate lyase activating enzyme